MASPFPSRPASQRTVHVYEATSTGMPVVSRYVAHIWEYRAYLWHLARTDLKAQHYDSVIGQAWLILDPLFEAAVYYLLRTVIAPVGTAEDRNAVVAHLIMGLFFFGYTRGALSAGSRCILSNRGAILSSSLPRALFPLEIVLRSLLDFLPTLGAYLVLHAALGQPFEASLIWLPVVLFLQTVLNLGMALLAGTVSVFFRDFADIVPYFTRIWLYVTPVLYTTAEIPPNLAPYLKLNPLYWFVATLEQIFQGKAPSAINLVMMVVFSASFFLVGSVYFLRRERDFAIRL